MTYEIGNILYEDGGCVVMIAQATPAGNNVMLVNMIGDNVGRCWLASKVHDIYAITESELRFLSREKRSSPIKWRVATTSQTYEVGDVLEAENQPRVRICRLYPKLPTLVLMIESGERVGCRFSSRKFAARNLPCVTESDLRYLSVHEYKWKKVDR